MRRPEVTDAEERATDQAAVRAARTAERPPPRGHLRMRAHPYEKARWQAAARAAGGLSLSEWLRAVADVASAAPGAPLEVRDELRRLRADLNRGVGNNLNQLAHRLHGTGQPPGESALAAAAQELARLRAEVAAVLHGAAAGRRT